MCILFVYTNPNPQPGEYRLILANNRDEVFMRASKPADRWAEDHSVIGGRDLTEGREGGTWLALSNKKVGNKKSIRIGCLLNIRTNDWKVLQGRGRGEIVSNYVLNEETTENYILNNLSKTKEIYNPYNFIGIEINENDVTTYHKSNMDSKDFNKIDTSKGCGFGNSLPEVPLKKVIAGEEFFCDAIKTFSSVNEKDKLVEELIFLLKWDTRHSPDEYLMKHACDWHENLSSIFVSIPEVGYGTRTHTIILIDYDGNIDYIEDSMQEPIQADQPIWRFKRIYDSAGFTSKI